MVAFLFATTRAAHKHLIEDSVVRFQRTSKLNAPNLNKEFNSEFAGNLKNECPKPQQGIQFWRSSEHEIGMRQTTTRNSVMRFWWNCKCPKHKQGNPFSAGLSFYEGDYIFCRIRFWFAGFHFLQNSVVVCRITFSSGFSFGLPDYNFCRIQF